MAKKKSEEKKDKPSPKKTKSTNGTIEIEKYPVTELLEKNKVKPLKAVGFLEYYGLAENVEKNFENSENIVEFTEGEFEDMYERFIRREI